MLLIKKRSFIVKLDACSCGWRLIDKMALKTFNLDEGVYKKFSEHCKKEGISMSKKVDNFIREELGRISGVVKDVKKGEEHAFTKYCH